MNQIYTQDTALDLRIETASELITQRNEGLKTTYRKIVDTLAKIRDFYQNDINQFLAIAPEKMLRKTYLGIFQPQTRLWLSEGTEYKIPTSTTVESFAVELKKCKNIMLLGGDSISSIGDANLCSDEGEWSMRKGHYSLKIQNLLTTKFFNENPSEIWRWHHEVKKTFVNKTSNKAQAQIADYQLYCALHSKKFDVATISVDGKHKVALDEAKKKLGVMTSRNIKSKYQPKIFELLGDINYRRCSKACPSNLNPGVDFKMSEGVVPKCRKCGMDSRPHVLLYDEDYSSADFGLKECLERLNEADCLIVADVNFGTSVELKMIEFALRKGIKIVEIAPNPKIEYGENVQYIVGNPVDIVGDLLKKAKDA